MPTSCTVETPAPSGTLVVPLSSGTIGVPLCSGTLGAPLSSGTIGVPLCSGTLGAPLSSVGIELPIIPLNAKSTKSKNGCEEQGHANHAKQAKHAKVQAARFPNKLKHAHSMPKFPKSFGPFREKLTIRKNFRKLMRQIMLNNFKIMLFPKERWFSQGALSNFRGLVSKNQGRRRARNRNITNKTPKEKGERSTRQRVPSARRFNLDFGFLPSVLQDPWGGFWSCQGSPGREVTARWPGSGPLEIKSISIGTAPFGWRLGFFLLPLTAYQAR